MHFLCFIVIIKTTEHQNGAVNAVWVIISIRTTSARQFRDFHKAIKAIISVCASTTDHMTTRSDVCGIACGDELSGPLRAHLKKFFFSIFTAHCFGFLTHRFLVIL